MEKRGGNGCWRGGLGDDWRRGEEGKRRGGWKKGRKREGGEDGRRGEEGVEEEDGRGGGGEEGEREGMSGGEGGRRGEKMETGGDEGEAEDGSRGWRGEEYEFDCLFNTTLTGEAISWRGRPDNTAAVGFDTKNFSSAALNHCATGPERGGGNGSWRGGDREGLAESGGVGWREGEEEREGVEVTGEDGRRGESSV